MRPPFVCAIRESEHPFLSDVALSRELTGMKEYRDVRESSSGS
jgi:hypothetical protein